MKKRTLNNKVAVPTIRRLPMYLKVIEEFQAKDQRTISCPQIAKELQLEPIQVRKDIASTGIVGTSRVGFEIKKLVEQIYHFLGWNNKNEAVLIGAGNLGQALLKYKNFQDYGFYITKVFDLAKNKIGKKIAGIEVQDLKKLEQMLLKEPVNLAVITVPVIAAQDIANILCRVGIKGIWNFAPIILKTPEYVCVENVSLSTNLAVLTKNVSDLERRKKMKPQIEIEICMGSSCFARGNKSALELVQDFVEKNNLHNLIAIKGSLCRGRCKEGPIIRINQNEYANIDAITILDELKELVKTEKA